MQPYRVEDFGWAGRQPRRRAGAWVWVNSVPARHSLAPRRLWFRHSPADFANRDLRLLTKTARGILTVPTHRFGCHGDDQISVIPTAITPSLGPASLTKEAGMADLVMTEEALNVRHQLRINSRQLFTSFASPKLVYRAHRAARLRGEYNNLLATAMRWFEVE
jgi:hypothetical protein